MKIELLYLPGCPDYLPALELIHDILAETGITAQVELVRVETEGEARRLKFIGSPTVRVDGLDVEPEVTFAAKDFGLRCRLYVEDGQVLGWPGRRMLRDLIEIGHLSELGWLPACC
jgi:hypothetical protein